LVAVMLQQRRDTLWRVSCGRRLPREKGSEQESVKVCISTGIPRALAAESPTSS
jgi:hypothetical protein